MAPTFSKGFGMKAIETKYKGYRFRSRLEARWAVFFDAMGWRWEYEPEGFDMDGVYYLPDFKVFGEDSNGDFNVFYFEVKPEDKPLTEIERKKIELFWMLCRSEDYSERPVKGYGDFILLDGAPDRKTYYSAGMCVSSEIASDMCWAMDFEYRQGRPTFDYDEYHGLRDIESRKKQYLETVTGFHCCQGIEYSYKAIQSARSARFEHGERP